MKQKSAKPGESPKERSGMKKAKHYFYLARCADDSLYAGTCVDPKEREAKHNAGTGAKYTRARLPVKFVYMEKLKDLSAARKREAEVKKWSRAKKLELLEKKSKDERRNSKH